MEEINIGQISEVLTTKADIDLGNTPFPTEIVNYVDLTNPQNITGTKTFFSNTHFRGGGIEIYHEQTPFIDFHYQFSEEDYTARIIEADRGHLSINQNPPTNDSSLKIATTQWVNSKISSVGVQPNWASIVSFTFPTSGAKYTAPANGIYFCCFDRSSLASISLNINGTNRLSRYTHPDYRQDQALNTIPLAKGDVIYWTAGATTVYCNVFVPYK